MRVDPAMDSYRDLRQETVSWLLIPLLASGFAIAIQMADPPLPAALGILLLALAAIVWSLRRQRYLASWVLTLGILGLASLAQRWFPQANAHAALIIAVLGAAATLGSSACVVTAALASLVLVTGGIRHAPSHVGSLALITNLVVLWIAAYYVCLSQRPQKTLVAWAWEGYEQERQALETARDRQVELKQALEDLALANSQTVRLNNLLSAARKAVDEARKAKQEFVANVSHELRTPLNMIIGFSDIILETPQVYARRLPQSLLADVAAIRRNSQHLANLVDDVLDLAEVDTGRLHLFEEWTSIAEVIGEATEAVAALFMQKGLALTTDIVPDLPAVYCDRTRIRQVVLNLLSNAGRFTEEGGAKIRAERRDDMIVVSISDTGPGMDVQSVSRLFEPFQQADQSIRRRYGGSGLGLAISKRFAEMHGGAVWLESKVGVGTTAFFTLPIRRNPPADSAKRWFGPYQEYAPRDRPSAAPSLTPKPRVVVVENSGALCQLAERYLDDLEPVRVDSLREANRAIEANAAVALVVNQGPLAPADRPLPDLATMAFDIPIISCWIPELSSAVSHMGAQDYLVKPVRQPELLESIHQISPAARLLLLVDDDPEARQLFGRMLTSAGNDYVVLHADSGTSALALMRERQPDLLLLDLVMPNGDGFAVLAAKSVDASIAAIPVIIMSAKDPHREPIVSRAMSLTRQNGLSARDLMLAIDAVAHALEPRIGDPVRSESPDGSLAC